MHTIQIAYSVILQININKQNTFNAFNSKLNCHCWCNWHNAGSECGTCWLMEEDGDSGNEVFQVQHILRKVQQCPHFQCCFKVSGVSKPTHENVHPNTSESVLARGVTVSSHCLVLWKSRTRRSGETKKTQDTFHDLLSLLPWQIPCFTTRSKPPRSQSVHPTGSGRRSHSEGLQATVMIYTCPAANPRLK